MDRPTAEQLIEIIESMDKRLNDLARVIETIEDENEKKSLRRAFAEITSLEYTEILLPIFRQFPDLEDEKLYGGGE